jgi:hypothetical protein
MEGFENAIRVFSFRRVNECPHSYPCYCWRSRDQIPLSLFDSLVETPLCNVKPSGKYLMKEFDEAGGLPPC